MGLDPNAAAHLMNVLTDLYSDPELAVLREYSTNAFDAHTEAGQKRPIEVELPAPLRPMLIVRDFGIGLDAEGIRSIYSQYGASTKRESNAMSGVLGLGCKSALTYTDQFTVVACKDGTKTTVSVSRDEDGGGTMKVLSTDPTDQPNGVEITIPAQRSNRFDELARDFFRFWKPGTVLVNGKQPDPISEWGGVKITDTIRAFKPMYRGYGSDGKGEGMAESWIVMGNVAYEADFTDAGLNRNVKLVAEVPIGSVNFAPSREALTDTKRTRETLQAVVAEYKANFAGAAQRALDAAPDKGAALKAWDESRFLGRSDGLTYKGIPLPNEFKPSKGSLYRLAKGTYSYGGEGAHVVIPGIDPTEAVGQLWVTDFDNGTWTAAMRRKLNAYVDAKINENKLPADTTTPNALLTPDAKVPAPDWLSACPTISWKDVRAWKIPGQGSTGSSPSLSFAGTYPTTTVSKDDDKTRYRDKHPANELDQSKPILYVIGRKGYGWNYRVEALALIGECYIVDLNDNRRAKFLRMFPKAKPLQETLEAKGKDWLDKQPQAAKEAAGYRMDRSVQSILACLGMSKVQDITDPDLRGGLEKAKRLSEDPAGNKLREFVRHSRHTVGQLQPTIVNIPLTAYPLLAETCQRSYNVNEAMKQHLIVYVNAVYAANKEQENQ